MNITLDKSVVKLNLANIVPNKVNAPMFGIYLLHVHVYHFHYTKIIVASVRLSVTGGQRKQFDLET